MLYCSLLRLCGDWPTPPPFLAVVLQALREAHLTANPKKCLVEKWETKYLGYVVGNRKVQPLVDKAEALANTPISRTKKHVWAFLGLGGYYRRCVLNFAQLAALLIILLKNQSLDKSHGLPSVIKLFGK